MSDTSWYHSVPSDPRLPQDPWFNYCPDRPHPRPVGTYNTSQSGSVVGVSSYSHLGPATRYISSLPSSRVVFDYQSAPTGFPGHNQLSATPSLPYLLQYPALGNVPGPNPSTLSSFEGLEMHSEVRPAFPTSYVPQNSLYAAADNRDSYSIANLWQMSFIRFPAEDYLHHAGGRRYLAEQSFYGDMGTSPYSPEKPRDVCGHMRNNPYPKSKKSMGLYNPMEIEPYPSYSSRKALFPPLERGRRSTWLHNRGGPT
jgi:hypothetical protein